MALILNMKGKYIIKTVISDQNIQTAMSHCTCGEYSYRSGLSKTGQVRSSVIRATLEPASPIHRALLAVLSSMERLNQSGKKRKMMFGPYCERGKTRWKDLTLDEISSAFWLGDIWLVGWDLLWGVSDITRSDKVRGTVDGWDFVSTLEDYLKSLFRVYARMLKLNLRPF